MYDERTLRQESLYKKTADCLCAYDSPRSKLNIVHDLVRLAVH